MKKKTAFFLLIIATLISGCGINSSNSTSYENSTSSSNSTTSNISDSYNSTIQYQKDSQGFYILDDKEYYVPLGDDDSEIKYYNGTIENISPNLRLYQEGQNIPLYSVLTNNSHTWTPNNYLRNENSVGIIQKKGPITLVLSTNFGLQHGATIRPLNKKIPYNVDETKRLITFTIYDAGQYTIEFRLNRTLHLFVDELGEYEQYRNNSNVVYFAPGIHNKSNDSRIDGNNNINVQSNQTIFIDYGAVIQGSLISNYTSNITIVGGGIIDGSTFERDAEKGTKQIPLDFNYCKNVTIKGISCLDPAGWAYNMYFLEDLLIENIKIITSRSNGDGISLQSCKRVNVNKSFVRSWDDSLVVKNYPHWSNKNNQGETSDIYFNNCIVWTDLAQSMEIGYETIGKKMDNINFTNITVLHNFHKPAISIHNANNADITNVKYQNIVIEDASMGLGDGQNILIELSTAFSPTWSTNHTTTELGSIKGVTMENIKVLAGRNNLEIRVLGSVDTRPNYGNSIHKIEDITFHNVYIFDKKIDEAYEFLYINSYISDVNFI